MKKLFILVAIFSLVLFTGCSDEKTEDTHYKPSEYKHNIAIGNASRAISDVNREIISMGAETSADIVADTYKNSLIKLNEQLATLEETKNKLSEDKDLTNSELTSWTSEYKNTIQGVKNTIKDVERQQTNFLK